MSQPPHLLAFGLLLLACLSLGGCGGSGADAPSDTPQPTPLPPPTGNDFVPFFASVFNTPVTGSTPVPVSGLTFTNQFPDDPSTFDFLLGP